MVAYAAVELHRRLASRERGSADARYSYRRHTVGRSQPELQAGTRGRHAVGSGDFAPVGVGSLCGCAAGELVDQTTPLDLLWGRASLRLCEQIFDAQADSAKMLVYQQALLERFAEVPHQPRCAHTDAIEAGAVDPSKRWRLRPAVKSSSSACLSARSA